MSEEPQSCLLIFDKARHKTEDIYINDVQYLCMYITPAAYLTTSLWKKRKTMQIPEHICKTSQLL